LSSQEIRIINKDLRQHGLDGNMKRFPKPGAILHRISAILQQHRLHFTRILTLDEVPEIHTNPTAFKNDNKSLSIELSRDNESSDAFMPGPQISNTNLYLSYTLESTSPEPRYSAIAYIAN
jgi:hypothetical protein